MGELLQFKARKIYPEGELFSISSYQDRLPSNNQIDPIHPNKAQIIDHTLFEQKRDNFKRDISTLGPEDFPPILISKRV